MNAKLKSLVALLALLAGSAWGFPQTAAVASGFGSSSITFNKIRLSFSAVSTGGEQPAVQARIQADKDVIHRWIFNRDGSLFFGYDFLVEAVPNSGRFQVTVRPLSQEWLEKFQAGGGAAGFGGGAGGRGMGMGGARSGGAPAAMARVAPTAVQPPPAQPSVSLTPSQSPSPQLIEDGDTISIDLLANPQSGVRIYDLIKVASSNRIMLRNETPHEAKAAARTRPPDTTTIWAYGFDVIVDGKVAGTTTGGCTGRFVYFSLASSRERFIMSTQPQEGYEFVQAGVIDGNSIRFQWNGVNYELLCSEPVLEGGAQAGLWLLVDTVEEIPTPFGTLRGAGAGGRGGGGSGGVARSGGAGGGSGTGTGGGGSVAGAQNAVVLEELRAKLANLVLQRAVNCGASSTLEGLVRRK